MNQILKNFIVFEGIDGAGKTTQLHHVSKILNEQGMPTSHTYEPHKGMVGNLIRDVLNTHIHELNSPYDENFSAHLLSYLFASDRYEHIYGKHGIRSQLETHDIVICDRYLFSSIAYQGEQCKELTYMLNKDFPLPQLLVYFDISPEASMSRMADRHKDGLETLENLRAVHRQYKEILTHYTQSSPEMGILSIDANSHPHEITDQILAAIYSLQ